MLVRPLRDLLCPAAIFALIAVTFPRADAAAGDLPMAAETTGCEVSVIARTGLKSDELEGTPCDDLIVVPPGIKTVDAGAGNDIVIGSPDLEAINGGFGEDLIFTNGTDVAFGGADDDIMIGGSPEDDASAKDFLSPALIPFEQRLGHRVVARALAGTAPSATSSPLADPVEGTPFDDFMYGGHGNDQFLGLGGDDKLFGGIGDDNLFGGVGDDLLAGGHGGDTLEGGQGSDWTRGDGTQDTLSESPSPNPGDIDVVSFASGVTPGFTSPNPSLTNFPSATGERGLYLKLATASDPTQAADNGVPADGGGVDTMRSGTDLSRFEVIVGTPFADYIVGSDNADIIFGGGGNDKIVGNGGNDTINGGAGGDHIDGGVGTNTINGDGGGDYCTNGTMSSCNEFLTGPAGVIPRQTSRVAVGFNAEVLSNPSDNQFLQLYLKGSDGDDNVSVSYSDPGGSIDWVEFTLSSGMFDTSSSEKTAGCDYSNATASPPRVKCTFQDHRFLDSIVMAGMGGNDALNVDASQLPFWTSITLLGGGGNDHLVGASGYDQLVDGPGDDVLQGGARDDGLINGLGSDSLYAGTGDDLILSTVICQAKDTLGGGGTAEKNNASWLQATSNALGVSANLATGTFGEFTPGIGMACPNSAHIGSINNVQNLEGTMRRDRFDGDAQRNVLIGWGGHDVFLGDAGNDVLIGYAPGTSASAHPTDPDHDTFYGGPDNDSFNLYDGQAEALVNCGAGSNDHGTGDLIDVPDPVTCENIDLVP